MHIRKPVAACLVVISAATLGGCLTKSLWSFSLADSANSYLSDTRLIKVDDQGRTFVVDKKEFAGFNPAPRIRLISEEGEQLWEITLHMLSQFGTPDDNKKQEFSLSYSALRNNALEVAIALERCEYIVVPGATLPVRECDAGRTDIATVTADHQITLHSLPVVGLYTRTDNGINIISPEPKTGTAADGAPEGVWAYNDAGMLLWRYDHPDFQNDFSSTQEILQLGDVVVVKRVISTGAAAAYQLVGLDVASGAQRFKLQSAADISAKLVGQNDHQFIVREVANGEATVKSYSANGQLAWSRSFNTVFSPASQYVLTDAVVTDSNICQAYRQIGAGILARQMFCLDHATGGLIFNSSLPYPTVSSANKPYTDFIKTRLVASEQGDVMVYDDAVAGGKVEGISFRFTPATGTASSVIYSQQVADLADVDGGEVRALVRGGGGLLLNNYSLAK